LGGAVLGGGAPRVNGCETGVDGDARAAAKPDAGGVFPLVATESSEASPSS
jgi:hypothetical protein